MIDQFVISHKPLKENKTRIIDFAESTAGKE